LKNSNDLRKEGVNFMFTKVNIYLINYTN